MSDGGWYAVDLDGTLATYDGWQGTGYIGEPIAPMVARVKKWIAEGIEVRIMTARVGPQDPPENAEVARGVIEAWCEKHLGKALQVTNQKDFGMIELWDDRCVAVLKNVGTAVRFDQEGDPVFID